MDEKQIHTFVDALYEVVSASQAETLMDFTADWRKSMTAVITAFKGLDGETAAMIKKIVISLFELAGERAKEGIKEGWQEKTEEGRMKKEDRKAKLERKAKPEEGKRGRHKKGL